jgi:biuret amidohydrolase
MHKATPPASDVRAPPTGARAVLQACLPAAAQLLEAARKAGMAVVHTLEAHKADLSDLPPSKWSRGNQPTGLRIGDDGDMGRILIRGEDGNGIVNEVAPIEVRLGARRLECAMT